MLRSRSSVVLIQNKKVGLIKRIRNDSVYYVFPGGGIEAGETPEEAAKREALEELGVKIKVDECIATIEFDGPQYYFLSEIIDGIFGTGHGKEFTDEDRGRGLYLPMWIEINRLSHIDVKPKEVALEIKNLVN
ncbi:NUDIX hydrolase [Aquibacillus rhizosphaerae]|uniref:NUDIX domain-containing protein n=1 Tax=Aquibacillus rhizosphaerae TaxID=3051431 RepID=A0ABT7LAQ9_9BACI|nr:NUDIX domain-containing protein [Aquibacillus sp. LR5S19]MDL4842347.1 NUDIX domain-containing protein [Aquibacillus sp. LR5S19]